jgi:hypothetical protein
MLIVLAYIVLGPFAFLIVGGLLNGIWEIIRDSIDQYTTCDTAETRQPNLPFGTE